MFFWLGRFLCAVVSCFLFPIRTEGREHIPEAGGFILACNHVSYLDPVVFGIACPRALNFMARDTLFRHPVFGRILRWVNAFPVKRTSADLGAIKEAIRRLRNGQGVLLFPEGTRGQGQGLGEGSAGAAFLARKARVGVVPAYVEGTAKVLPRGAKFLRPSCVRVIFGEPFFFSEEAALTDEALTAEIMRRIASLRRQ